MKKKKTKTLREVRLDETISGFQPERLEGTRKTINDEIASARAKVDSSEELSKTDAVEMVVAGAAEDETNPPAPQLTAAALVSQVEDQRTQKLDLITDIQLILVARFQRLFKAMVVFCIVAVLCLVAVVMGIFVGFDIRDDVSAVTADQKAMIERQKLAIGEQEKIAESVKDTAESVEDTKKAVKEVADSVPQVEVDPKTGKKTLVVSEKKHKKGDPQPKKAEPKPKGTQYPPRPPWHQPAPPPPAKEGKHHVPLPGLN